MDTQMSRNRGYIQCSSMTKESTYLCMSPPGSGFLLFFQCLNCNERAGHQGASFAYSKSAGPTLVSSRQG